MKFAFRADASTLIGTGHVMRCLTLAHALRDEGGECFFICRDLPGNLAEKIRRDGFEVVLLTQSFIDEEIEGPPEHATWAGVTWQQDAQDTQRALQHRPSDWLIVDHYAFDARWEKDVAAHKTRILVIDDLANRPHECDLLLDQNLGRKVEDYQRLVPAHSKCLIGPKYATLRPEFTAMRPKALEARIARLHKGVNKVLISMGGVDRTDVTSKILDRLLGCNLVKNTQIIIVMGGTAPARNSIRERVANLPLPIKLLTDVSNMASLIAEADLAISALGMSTWERAALGLPSLVTPTAENQREVAQQICAAGAAAPLDVDNLCQQLDMLTPKRLEAMSLQASTLVDGQGTQRVVREIHA